MLSLLWILACGVSAPPASPDVPRVEAEPYDLSKPLPKESLYQLKVNLVDQHGKKVDLSVNRGHPTIISMFYASCPTACPMLIQDVKNLEEKLDPDVLHDTRVLLVSLDPERDDPAALAEVIKLHDLDDTRWTLTRTELADVRLVAAALDVSFRALPDGEMNHSSLLIALDRDGVIQAKLEGLQQDPTVIINALSK